MAQGKKSLYQAQNRFQIQKADNLHYISGNLGFMIGGVQTVSVKNREGFVYVRLRSNSSEVIQAYNDKVALVYDLPVLIARDKINTNRYYIVSLDSQKYPTWNSSYVPKHGSQHSFNPPLEGGDVTWIYGEQFMPLSPFPSGTYGGDGIVINPYIFFSSVDSSWHYINTTGTFSVQPYKPTGTSACMLLVYLDGVGNLKYRQGSMFSSAYTGTYQVVPYIPAIQTGEIPIAGLRLVSGTSTLLWDDVYDLRPYYSPFA